MSETALPPVKEIQVEKNCYAFYALPMPNELKTLFIKTIYEKVKEQSENEQEKSIVSG